VRKERKKRLPASENGETSGREVESRDGSKITAKDGRHERCRSEDSQIRIDSIAIKERGGLTISGDCSGGIGWVNEISVGKGMWRFARLGRGEKIWTFVKIEANYRDGRCDDYSHFTSGIMVGRSMASCERYPNGCKREKDIVNGIQIVIRLYAKCRSCGTVREPWTQSHRFLAIPDQQRYRTF
jgi:hypothetical protein